MVTAVRIYGKIQVGERTFIRTKVTRVRNGTITYVEGMRLSTYGVVS